MKKQTKHFLLFFLLCFGFFLWYSPPLVLVGSDNLRMVEAFDSDEAIHLKLIERSLKNKDGVIPYDYYGHMYFNMALYPLWFKQNLGYPVSQRQIILVLRAIPVFFSFLCVLLVFLMGRMLGSLLAAWLAGLSMLLGYPDFLINSFNSHPDIVQLFFILASIAFLILYAGKRLHRYMLIAASCAGMAFANKYSGLFILPILMVSYALIPPKQKLNNTLVRYFCPFAYLLAAFLLNPLMIEPYLLDNDETTVFLSIFTLASVSAFAFFLLTIISFFFFDVYYKTFKYQAFRFILPFFVFFISFMISSFDSFIDLKFINGILKISSHINSGHWFYNSFQSWSWFGVLYRESMLGFVGFGYGLLAFVFALIMVLKKKARVYTVGFVLIWVMVFFGYLLARIRVNFQHYLLPVVPFLFLIMAYGVDGLWRFINFRFKAFRWGLMLLVMLPLGFNFKISLQHILTKRLEYMGRDKVSDQIKQGAYIAEHYSSEVKIMADHYNYTPPKYENYILTWGMNKEMVELEHPDLIITTSISEEFKDIHKAIYYKEGEEVYLEKHHFYTALQQSKLPYRKVAEFGKIIIFERSDWR